MTILPHSWSPAPQKWGHRLSTGRKTPTHRPARSQALAMVTRRAPAGTGCQRPSHHHPNADISPPVCWRLPPSWQPACAQQLPTRPAAGCRSPQDLSSIVAVSLHHRSPPPARAQSQPRAPAGRRVPVQAPRAGSGLSGAAFATAKREPMGFWCPPSAPSASPAGKKPGSSSQTFCSLTPAEAEGIRDTSDGTRRWMSSQRSRGHLRARAQRGSSSVH